MLISFKVFHKSRLTLSSWSAFYTCRLIQVTPIYLWDKILLIIYSFQCITFVPISMGKILCIWFPTPFASKAASLYGWSMLCNCLETLLKIWHYICCDSEAVLIKSLLSIVQTFCLWVPLHVLDECPMVQTTYETCFLLERLT